MICPTCGNDNVPGIEVCSRCLQDLTQLDRPVAHERVERLIMHDPVRSLPTKPPVLVRPDATIDQVIHALIGPGVGAVLVVDDAGKLCGIFTERDLLTKITGRPEPLEHLVVSDFMTASPETVTADDTLAFVLHKMDIGGYRHVPVLDNGLPVGIVSVRAMLRHLTHLGDDT